MQKERHRVFQRRLQFESCEQRRLLAVELFGVEGQTGNLYQISPTDATVTLIGNTSAIDLASLEFAPDGRLLAYSLGPNPLLYEIDPDTAAAQQIASINQPIVEGGLAIDTDGNALAANGGQFAPAVLALDLDTGAATHQFNLTTELNGLAYRADGTLVGIKVFDPSFSAGSLVTFNNGVESPLGSVIQGVGVVGGLAILEDIGYLVTGGGPGSNQLLEFDPLTGAQTVIGSLAAQITTLGITGLAAREVIDVVPPQVVSIEVNTLSADPADVPGRGPQPTRWTTQRSDLVDVTVTFDQPIIATPTDIELVNLGLNVPNDTAIPVALTAQHVAVDGETLTLRFDDEFLAEGVYSLTLAATITNAEGVALDGNGDGVGGDARTFVGNQEPFLYRLVGDFNQDAGVSIFDFATFSYWFGVNVPNAPRYADLNRDGGISVFDFPTFASNFGVTINAPIARPLKWSEGNEQGAPRNANVATRPIRDEHQIWRELEHELWSWSVKSRWSTLLALDVATRASAIGE